MFARIRKALKKTSRVAYGALALGVVSVMIPASAIAWGPDRPLFDSTKPPVNGSTCTSADIGQFNDCGSLTGPVFDSFKNASGYGNETNFERIAPVNGNNAVSADYSDALTATPGQQYWVRIYIHNNANQDTNCDSSHISPTTDACTQLDPGSKGLATNTHVSLAFDGGQANSFDLTSHITADNATPNDVWDGATLTNNNNVFSISYVPGSAFALTAQQNTTPQPISDAIVNPGGIELGEDFNGTLNNSGVYPGCFNFVTYIFLKVQVKAPSLVIHKVAYITGTQEEVDGKTIADTNTVTWRIYVADNGNDVANNVTIRDLLPNGATLVPNSLKLYNASNNGTVQDSTNQNDFFNAGGINVGNYSPLTADELATFNDGNPLTWDYNVLLTYQTTMTTSPTICTLQNQAFTRATGVNEIGTTSTVNLTHNGNSCVVLTSATPPKALVNTGPGDVAGLFGGVSAAGAFGYRKWLSRRLGR